jgi:glutamyl-tRNA reductase
MSSTVCCDKSAKIFSLSLTAQILSDYLATTHNIAREKLDPYLVYFEGDDALKHICRVADG